MNIAILYGQPIEGAGKDEQDTLVQVEMVVRVLHDAGHSTFEVPLSLNLERAEKRLRELQPDLVFNLVESVAAQGRLIHLGPALLDALHLPYTGGRTEGMFLTSNKLLAKQLLNCSGLPTPRWFSADALNDNIPITTGRYILKSVWEHASVGLSENSVLQAGAASELREALERRLDTLGGEGFVEAYIEGREFNLALLGSGQDVRAPKPQVLPPAEIRFDSYPEQKLKIVDYHAKWDEESFEYQNTPRRFDFSEDDNELLERLKTIARDCWKLFDLRGYARVDFRVDEEGNPWILEINANPCLSPDAGFMAAAEQTGLTMNDVIERIINDIV